MKILFLSAVLPYPLYSGGQIRIYNLLKRLSEHHEIWLYSFIREEQEKQLVDQLSFCHHVETVYRGRAWRPEYLFRALLGPYPLLLSTYDNAVMKQRISDIIQKNKFDLIHIEPGYVWPSLPEHIPPLVVSEHNVEHHIYESYRNTASALLKPVMKRDVHRLTAWEKVIWQKAKRVVAVSESDAQEMSSLGAPIVDVVPNGVDEDQFRYMQKKQIAQDFHCLFVGNFRWMQNTDAVRFLLQDVWPRVIRRFPHATLSVVGRDLPASLEKLLLPSVTHEQHVEDITVEFNKADILLAPIRIGGGTKYKILEAMAIGVPVITTKKGIEGLSKKAFESVVLASAPDEWEEEIVRLVEDNQLRKKLVKNARELIEKEYTWSKIAEQLNTVWLHAAA